jgi:hypothetical protein
VLFLRQSGLLEDANARARLWSRSSELSDTKQGLSDTKCRLGILTATGRGGVIYMDASNEEFVLVIGVVYRRTSLGVFLDVVDRCVFIPTNCTSTPSFRFRPGENSENGRASQLRGARKTRCVAVGLSRRSYAVDGRKLRAQKREPSVTRRRRS